MTRSSGQRSPICVTFHKTLPSLSEDRWPTEEEEEEKLEKEEVEEGGEGEKVEEEVEKKWSQKSGWRKISMNIRRRKRRTRWRKMGRRRKMSRRTMFSHFVTCWLDIHSNYLSACLSRSLPQGS